MKNRMKEIRVFTPSFNIGLLITAVVAVGTYFNVPPMSTVVQIGSHFKQSAAEKYGEPPCGRAELSSLEKFSQKESIDLGKALDLLKEAGLQVEDADQARIAIARANGTTPQQIYAIIKPGLSRAKGRLTSDSQ